jgi:hypothetical protein
MMTDAETEQFRCDGYFIDRGVFSPDDLETLRPLARRVQL